VENARHYYGSRLKLKGEFTIVPGWLAPPASSLDRFESLILLVIIINYKIIKVFY
jgi:hypothetical protein